MNATADLAVTRNGRKQRRFVLEDGPLGILDDEEDVEKRSSGIELPMWMWERLERIALKRGKSRNWVMTRLLKVAIEWMEREPGFTPEELDRIPLKGAPKSSGKKKS